MYAAIKKRDLNQVYELITTGATVVVNAADVSVTGRGRYGWTPLHHACENNFPEAVKALLDAGAVVDALIYGNRTPLHMACEDGFEEVARLLIAAGADVDAKTSSGWTPLHHACYRSKPKIVLALLEAGADSTVQSNTGLTPLDTTCVPEIQSILGQYAGGKALKAAFAH